MCWASRWSVRPGQQKMVEQGQERAGENVREKLILLCSDAWSHNGGNHFRPLKMTLHAVLAALLWFAVAALCMCCSHGSSSLAVPWQQRELLQWPYAWEAYHLQFPHSRLQPSTADAIVTSSIELKQEAEREREICQYCSSAGTEIKTVCVILSDSSPCAKSPFCVTHLHKIRICPYVS